MGGDGPEGRGWDGVGVGVFSSFSAEVLNSGQLSSIFCSVSLGSCHRLAWYLGPGALPVPASSLCPSPHHLSPRRERYPGEARSCWRIIKVMAVYVKCGQAYFSCHLHSAAEEIQTRGVE